MDWYLGQHPVCIRCRKAYLNEKVTISASEPGDPDGLGQSVLSVKRLVQIQAKVLLDAEGLQEESTHPHNPLLGRIGLVFEGIEQDQNDEVVYPLGVDDEGSESFIALRDLPEEHYDFRGKLDRRLSSRNVRNVGL